MQPRSSYRPQQGRGRRSCPHPSQFHWVGGWLSWLHLAWPYSSPFPIQSRGIYLRCSPSSSEPGADAGTMGKPYVPGIGSSPEGAPRHEKCPDGGGGAPPNRHSCPQIPSFGDLVPLRPPTPLRGWGVGKGGWVTQSAKAPSNAVTSF
eukprot:SAG31_NODE_5339_length_2600_cov_2.395442_1_plen_148_part_00